MACTCRCHPGCTTVCGKFESLPTEIRKYSHLKENPLPIHTVRYIAAKGHVPVSVAGGLGDHAACGCPVDEDYAKTVPDFGSPVVAALGVLDGSQQWPFPIRVSDSPEVEGWRSGIGTSHASSRFCLSTPFSPSHRRYRQNKRTKHWRNFPRPSQWGPLLVEATVQTAPARGNCPMSNRWFSVRQRGIGTRPD